MTMLCADECLGGGACGDHGDCVNTLGSFACSCHRGFRLSPSGAACLDVDECEEERPCRRRNAACSNLPGSYECSCEEGFRLTGDGDDGGCADVDECGVDNGGEFLLGRELGRHCSQAHSLTRSPC